MEKITKREGCYYYGENRCQDADDAYERFRNDYHESLGKRVYRRLNRVGQRVERVHEFGFCFAGEWRTGSPDVQPRLVSTRLLGLVCGSYCRMLGEWDIPGEVRELDFEEWYDRTFSAGSKALRLVGRKAKAGRTSKLQNKRYR